jgi:hypothetical protein
LPPPKVFPPVPCPSSWCGQSTDCQTWTCEQPYFAAPGQYTCTPVNTAGGTQCQDESTCITNGACNGTGLCQPRQPSDRDVCFTTLTGRMDGYTCGRCDHFACEAARGGNIEYPAPSFACVVGPATQ